MNIQKIARYNAEWLNNPSSEVADEPESYRSRFLLVAVLSAICIIPVGMSISTLAR
ncbi:MAG: hypothetical protein P8J17_10410 [Halioglobus sp.]|nr:hypothetical protein [Halioglobus sp.]